MTTKFSGFQNVAALAPNAVSPTIATPLEDELRDKAKAAIYRTWGAIAYDIELSREQCEETGEMPMVEVAEVALDQVESHGQMDAATRDWLRALSYDDSAALALEAVS